MKMILYYHAIKTHFHKKGFALGLVLRVRVFGTRKWPISTYQVTADGETAASKRPVTQLFNVKVAGF